MVLQLRGDVVLPAEDAGNPRDNVDGVLPARPALRADADDAWPIGVGGEVGDAELGQLVEAIGVVGTGSPGVGRDDPRDELGRGELVENLGHAQADALEVAPVAQGDVPAGLSW